MKVIRSGGGGCNDIELPDTVAGANGQDEIELKAKVARLISVDSVAKVNKLTGAKVKEAVSMMKPGKGDVSGGYHSDALLHGPDILFDQLATVFRSWLIHGTVTMSLLACAFLPLLKSSLKDPADPGSYRAIAGSSLLLKLFEKVILLIWGGFLATDILQFGYKPGTSTTQC